MNSTISIKIDDGLDRNLAYYGMEVVSSPEAFGVNIKKSNIIITDFPEEDGDVVYIPDNPSVESFDYKMELAVVTKIGESPAVKIADFVSAVMGKKITITNTLKRIKIDGYFSGYKDVRYYNDRVSVFEVTIYVPSGRSTAY